MVRWLRQRVWRAMVWAKKKEKEAQRELDRIDYETKLSRFKNEYE